MEEGGSPPPLAALCWRGASSLNHKYEYQQGTISVMVLGIVCVCGEPWNVTEQYVPATYSISREGIVSV